MRNYHTNDHIFTLIFIIREANANKRKVYYFFVEFHKEFESVPQLLLANGLKDLGLPPLVVSLVVKPYETIIGKV